ncbi:MAG: LysR family transcriptional regulator [Gammaproteobacteria bacterium]
MKITLRQLEIYSAVARHLSYTRASEALHLTQPAVSMQVRQLEEAVEMPLIEQVGKRIFLTDAGKEMVHYAKSILGSLAEAEQVFQKMRGLEGGRLRLSVASTANYFVPTILANFCQQYPKIKISLDVTNREGLLEALTDNSVDLVIMGKPPDSIDLVSEKFMKNPLVLIAPPTHHLAKERKIPLKQLQKETFLVREPGSGTRTAIEKFLKVHKVELTSTMEMSTSEAIKQGIEAGLGLGLLSLHTLGMELELGRLTILDGENLPIIRDWYITYRQGKRLSLAAEKFRGFVLQEAVAFLELPELPDFKDNK